MSRCLAVVYSDDNNEVFLGKDYGHVNNYSEATSARIDEQIEKMMRKAYSQTESILKTHYDKLELVAETLIKNEKISGDEFTQLMKNGFIADEKVSEKEEVHGERIMSCGFNAFTSSTVISSFRMTLISGSIVPTN